jgi:hypothetical protein
MNSNQMMTRFRPITPPILDRAALDGASQLREAVHNLVREVNERMTKIEADGTVDRNVIMGKRADAAREALAKLSNLT